ncbi:translation initiation factor eIF-2B delta subunit [Coemansia reversa NRRL 1564]|uniref:Translation initiation factor eIF2B subunit delta n=1 Tax=Coemansia reversa (strain ATCC 12441 / NRRL 1564) TaxID=763665 RepID=A0A2G5BD60_COERN|nr:translation initiation factor eIF-2B delta subunit [Coemansia reversa NRRL 1564]|eukprot:PIA16647.1 translation initiation factor eIF-2B delta subunit [Coemansia reversa NRRL 1564]
MPPFASGAGQRKLPKPSGSTVGIAVHPRIKEVGLRMATMDISGSNARTVAVMLAFIDVIADYTTPPHTTLVYHLTGYLSPQINFLVHQRPMCIGMANAIRWLKSEIIHTSHDLKEDEAKSQLISKIDGYIKERITAAGDIIADAGAQKIQDGDVVLTFGASSAVQNLLITARKNGRRFHVIVIDSRPEHEGRGLVRRLSKGGNTTGLSDGVTYASLTALSLLMRDASKVFLGAEAFFANGNMLSRAGTAMVALSAHSCHVPVIVTCETYKFNERIQLDAVVNNELGVPDALIDMSSEAMAQDRLNKVCPLNDWRANQRLRLLNLTQDVTPPEFVSVIITEVGLIPTTSIPVVLREYKNQI